MSQSWRKDPAGSRALSSRGLSASHSVAGMWHRWTVRSPILILTALAAFAVLVAGRRVSVMGRGGRLARLEAGGTLRWTYPVDRPSDPRRDVARIRLPLALSGCRCAPLAGARPDGRRHGESGTRVSPSRKRGRPAPPPLQHGHRCGIRVPPGKLQRKGESHTAPEKMKRSDPTLAGRAAPPGSSSRQPGVRDRRP